MNRNLKLQRNILFYLLLLGGVGYLSLLFTIFTKVFSGFAMQLILLAEYFKSPSGSILEFILSSEFLIPVLIGVFSLSLVMKVIAGIFKSASVIMRTQRYITSCKILKSDEEFNIFKSSKDEVFTVGFFRPEIYISECLYKKLTRKQFIAVLLHERTHQRSFDPLRDLLVDFVQNITPNFPSKKDVFENYTLVTELLCDQYAEGIMETKRPLIEALGVMLLSSTHDYRYGSGYLTKGSRISILLGNSKLRIRKYLYFLLFTFIFLIVGGFYTQKVVAFPKCEHLLTCLEVLISGEGHFNHDGNEVCVESDGVGGENCVHFENHYPEFQNENPFLSVPHMK